MEQKSVGNGMRQKPGQAFCAGKLLAWLAGILTVCAVLWFGALQSFAEEENPLGVLMQIAGNLADTASQTTEETQTQSGTYSILLVGSDRRDDSWNGNSDTMILVTVNEENSQVTMVSFMRDLGVDIPENGTQKLNAAFAIGGSDLLKNTLTSNFNVHIDNYAAVDFYEMIDIVDALGGVDMEIRDEEVQWVNMYIESMCPYMGLNAYDYLLSSGGYLHLNGMQAVAFCRVRFAGDNDYERTERQRRVLSALIASLDPGNPEEMVSLLIELLVKVDTDITVVDAARIAPIILKMSDYTLKTGRVPFDGLYTSQGEMLMPVQPDTNIQLQQLIYG